MAPITALWLFPLGAEPEPLSIEVFVELEGAPAAEALARTRKAPAHETLARPMPSEGPAQAEKRADSLAGDEVQVSAAAPALGTPSGRELDASERYAAELRQWLERRKVYPATARRMGKQGRVLVKFRLRRDGSILHAQVIEASSHEVLNDAAKELVRAVNGFRPFPDEITKTAWDFLVPIDYKL